MQVVFWRILCRSSSLADALPPWSSWLLIASGGCFVTLVGSSVDALPPSSLETVCSRDDGVSLAGLGVWSCLGSRVRVSFPLLFFLLLLFYVGVAFLLLLFYVGVACHLLGGAL